MGVDDADRTLFVGNLHPRVTEEILFELFLQAGPIGHVKIPKDKDGTPKLFGFITFKHEESVHFAMNLLNGIKLYGRPLKIQFRSGSTHVSQDANNAVQSPQGNAATAGNGQASDGNSYPRQAITDLSPVPSYQRPYSSPDNLQRQAMMNNFYKQESHGARAQMMGQQPSPPPSSYTPSNNWQYGSSSNHPTPHRYESGHRHSRNHGKNESYHSREVYNGVIPAEHHYRGHGSEEHHYRGHGSEVHHYQSRGHSPRWGPPHH